MEAFLKSRANSVGPLEGVLGGEPGHEAGEHAFDSMAMDSMLANGGFWDNVSRYKAASKLYSSLTLVFSSADAHARFRRTSRGAQRRNGDHAR